LHALDSEKIDVPLVLVVDEILDLETGLDAASSGTSGDDDGQRLAQQEQAGEEGFEHVDWRCSPRCTIKFTNGELRVWWSSHACLVAVDAFLKLVSLLDR
jgi:hypothetical protein